MTGIQKVAFLGPLGTFSHQACVQMFGNEIELSPQATITASYEAIDEAIPHALLPAENSTHGYVVDTYDILRLPAIGTEIFVRGDTVLRIELCLVAPKHLKVEDVCVVISHEQAIGQCAQFLRKHLPYAEWVKCSSTAEAARMVLQDPPEAGRAAISCRVVLEQYPGLHILRESIQDQGDNFTRFLYLALKSTVDIERRSSLSNRAIIRVQPSVGGAGVLPLLVTLNLEVLKIDRRPSLLPDVFHDVYLIEVNAAPGVEIADAVARVNDAGGNAKLLGRW